MSSATHIASAGGGAIGAAVAYFTSRRGARTTVIERHAVAGAASGKSGGFLALDWCRGSPLDRLARRSFELHAQLSIELGDPWGYRCLTTYGGYAVEDDTRAVGAGGGGWLTASRSPLIDRQLLQRLTLDARHDTGNEPARQAHLDDRNQCAGWFEGNEGPTQINVCMGSSIGSQRTMDAISTPPPDPAAQSGVRS